MGDGEVGELERELEGRGAKEWEHWGRRERERRVGKEAGGRGWVVE